MIDTSQVFGCFPSFRVYFSLFSLGPCTLYASCALCIHIIRLRTYNMRLRLGQDYKSLSVYPISIESTAGPTPPSSQTVAGWLGLLVQTTPLLVSRWWLSLVRALVELHRGRCHKVQTSGLRGQRVPVAMPSAIPTYPSVTSRLKDQAYQGEVKRKMDSKGEDGARRDLAV